MAIRSKTKVRLFILLAAILLLGSGVGIGAFVRLKQIEHDIQQLRSDGLAAIEAGDDVTALKSLGKYVNKNKQDVEALYALAGVRQQIEEPRGKHIAYAAGMLRRVIDLDPDHPTARHDLLKLFTALQHSTEAQEIAEYLLRKSPDDPDAIRALAIALVRVQEYEQALPWAVKYSDAHPDDLQIHALVMSVMGQLHRSADELLDRAIQFNEHNPLDLEGQILTLKVMMGVGRPGLEMIGRAESLKSEHPQDPRFLILLSIAHDANGDRATAIEFCRSASEYQPPDRAFLLRVVKTSDAFGLYEESLLTLRRYARQMDDPAVERFLFQRLWEREYLAEILEGTKDLEPDDADADSEILALRATSLHRTKRGDEGASDEAVKIREALAERKDDNLARAWANILEKIFENPENDGKGVVAVSQDALARVPGHPYFLFLLGTGYRSLGESEQALESWRKLCIPSGDIPPVSWPAPFLHSARVLLASGRFMQAFDYAREALRRAPKNLEAAALFAEVIAANLDELSDDADEELLRLVEQIQITVPGEPRTLGIHFMLLIRAGKADEARQVLQQVLVGTPPKESVLIKMAGLSLQAQIGLEDACLDLSEKTYGRTPKLVYARAVQSFGRGGVTEGLKLLEEGLAEADETDVFRWRVARAQYLVVANDERAKATWIELADELHDNLKIQTQVLKYELVWSNLEFVDRTIKRLRELSSEKSPVWRNPRAKYFLVSKEDAAAASDAADLLEPVVRGSPDLLESQLLLATAYRRMGKLSGAEEHLTVAVKLLPRAKVILLERARVRIDLGQMDLARSDLVAAISGDGLTALQRWDASMLLNRVGANDLAIEQLESLGEDAEQDAKLQLAVLYREQEQFDKVEAICLKLMEAPTSNAIRFVVDFHASQGRHAEALETLAKLDDMGLDKTTWHLIRAAFYSKYMGPDRARREYQEALQAAPDHRDLQVSYVQFLFTHKQIDQAVEAIQQLTQRFPEDEWFQLMAEHAELLSDPESVTEALLLFPGLLGDASHRLAITDAMRVLKQEVGGQDGMQKRLASLRDLANRNPEAAAIQNVLIAMYIKSGLHSDALEASDRALQAFPSSITPASGKTDALMRLGRLTEALAAAKEWRRRAMSAPLGADLIIAKLHLSLGDPSSALAQMEPYLDRALETPDANAPIIISCAAALLASRQIEAVEDLMAPLIERSREWRTAWSNLLTSVVEVLDVSEPLLVRLGALIDNDDIEERLMYVQSWSNLAIRTKRAEYVRRAYQLIKPLTEREDVTGQVWERLAMMEDAAARFEEAEKGYREAIRLDPTRGIALNNLAMILLNRAEDLEEARTSAQRAVDLMPNNPNFRDTLAAILLSMGDHQGAIENMQVAMDSAPNQLVWMVNMLELLLESGDFEQAREHMNRIDAAVVANRDVADHVQERLDNLRTRLRQSESASAPTP